LKGGGKPGSCVESVSSVRGGVKSESSRKDIYY
jgi:hypothetical protein